MCAHEHTYEPAALVPTLLLMLLDSLWCVFHALFYESNEVSLTDCVYMSVRIGIAYMEEFYVTGATFGSPNSLL